MAPFSTESGVVSIKPRYVFVSNANTLAMYSINTFMPVRHKTLDYFGNCFLSRDFF